MLKVYSISTEWYKNNELICRGYLGRKIFVEEPTTERIEITWDYLKSDIFGRIALDAPFNVWNLKGGRRISFFDCPVIPFGKKYQQLKDISESKVKELNMHCLIKYTEFEPTIEEILKIRDDLAIQYLVERGLDISKKL